MIIMIMLIIIIKAMPMMMLSCISHTHTHTHARARTHTRARACKWNLHFTFKQVCISICLHTTPHTTPGITLPYGCSVCKRHLATCSNPIPSTTGWGWRPGVRVNIFSSNFWPNMFLLILDLGFQCTHAQACMNVYVRACMSTSIRAY